MIVTSDFFLNLILRNQMPFCINVKNTDTFIRDYAKCGCLLLCMPSRRALLCLECKKRRIFPK